MFWVTALVEEIVKRHPDGEILVSSGASPSGTYHMGHLREIVTADAIVLALRQKERQARHVHFVDDLDALRKIPVNLPTDYGQYLGKPLCDIPAPDGSDKSYADFFLQGLLDTANALGIDMEVVRSHEKYRNGWFVPAIERVLDMAGKARETLETVGGRQLDEHWSPIQVMEDGYLKNRKFVSINKATKMITYEDRDSQQHAVRYDNGGVKLDWRLDWPARWWLLRVNAEPFGRDHASAGGSYATGEAIMKTVFEAAPPLPIPYDFINRAGDTKKMSASKGTGIDAGEVVKVLPAEVVRFFMLRFPPDKRLYFDQVDGTVRLVDEFAELSARAALSNDEKELLNLSTRGLHHRTVSSVPFSHLVASFQAALQNTDKTLEIIRRTEHAQTVENDGAIIKEELEFIKAWLEKWAPEEVKFNIEEHPDYLDGFSESQKAFLKALADKIEQAPEDADGEWFHKSTYELKDQSEMEPKEMFTTLYRALINKDSGPRAGWFLATLVMLRSKDWLLRRLRLEA